MKRKTDGVHVGEVKEVKDKKGKKKKPSEKKGNGEGEGEAAMAGSAEKEKPAKKKTTVKKEQKVKDITDATTTEGGEDAAVSTESKKKSRFIVFVGPSALLRRPSP